MIEIQVTLGMGALILIYGLYYFFDPEKYMIGITAIFNSLLVAVQCLLMHKFYITSKKTVAEKKD